MEWFNEEGSPTEALIAHRIRHENAASDAACEAALHQLAIWEEHGLIDRRGGSEWRRAVRRTAKKLRLIVEAMEADMKAGIETQMPGELFYDWNSVPVDLPVD